MEQRLHHTGRLPHLEADVRRRGTDLPEALPRVLVEKPVSHVESGAAPHLFHTDTKKGIGFTHTHKKVSGVIQGDNWRAWTSRKEGDRSALISTSWTAVVIDYTKENNSHKHSRIQKTITLEGEAQKGQSDKSTSVGWCTNSTRRG